MNSRTLPPEWKRGHVSDIAIINPSVRLDGLEPNDEVTFLTMADVGENGRVLNRQVRRLREVRNGFTRFEEGDVLFAKITPCMQNGKGAYATGLTNGHGFGSTEFHVIRANEHGDSVFLSHVSLSHELRSKAVSYFSGSAGQQRVSSDFFTRHPMLIPPRPQQRKIARILTTVDNLIEKTEALIAKYQAIKQGMMHDLFTRGVDSRGHLRPPYEEAPELYKQSELGWIPKEWETKRLNDAIRIIDCKHYTPMFRQEGVAFIRPRNVKVDGLDFSDVEYVSAEDYRLLTDKHVPNKGDIVFSRNASFGVPCYIDHDRSFAIGQDTVVMTETKANTKYIFYALLSAPTEMQVRRASTGSTFGRINLAFIRDLRIPLPPRGETSQIAKILDNLVARSNIEASSAEKLSIIKLGLMQDLLTGKVRVQVDEADEVGHDGGI